MHTKSTVVMGMSMPADLWKDCDVRIASTDGTTSFSVAPVGYQFSAAQKLSEDRNWLQVELRVVLADGRQWEVVDPCLTTAEATSVSGWLAEAVRGTQPVATELDIDEPSAAVLSFLEPNFALAVCAYPDASTLTLRVLLSYCDLASDAIYGTSVDITLTRTALAEAAAEWREQLVFFPPR